MGSDKASSLKELEKTWYRWEVRAFIIIGLCLQIILTLFGFRRKYIIRSWIKLLVWSAYLGANWMATVALGNLGNYEYDTDCSSYTFSEEQCGYFKDYLSENSSLKVLWSAFFLLHLGGPDTISAYSLEDNELWSRTFFAFIANIWAVFYLVIVSWSNIAFPKHILIPITIYGIIKYGERVFVLWSSSTERFKESLLSNPDPFPDLVKITKQDMEKELEEENFDIESEATKKESRQIFEAFFLFKRFANIFADLILDENELLVSYKICLKLAEDAFNLVAIELGIMYDVLYTKAILVYSRLGIFLRCFSFFSSIYMLIAWSLPAKKLQNEFPLSDFFVTFSLLIVTVVIEALAVIELCSSDWATVIRLTRHKKAWQIPGFGNRKRWSMAMGQFNLLRCCIKDMSAKHTRVQNIFFIGKRLKNHLYLSWENVNVDLQKMIFKELSEKIGNYELQDHFCDTHLLKKILGQRGDYVLEERYKLVDFYWCVEEVDFDHSLLLWHIATDLCYYDDFDKHEVANNDLYQNSKIGKCLSDYMLYILVVCPSMMPKGNGELRFRETCVMVRRFIESSKTRSTSVERVEDCKFLLRNNIDNLKSDDMSVLVEGCNLAKQLQSLESEDGWNRNKKWKMITEVWVEMLTYAANECDWKVHGHHLRKGGELLTHVRLLMTHCGLSVQYNKNGRKID
ncbi:uncharacterized protein LOC116128404 [Pistacia vera]|uniref:uncharacterized protein LOC116128404 n=1 Tax=Pistacia vera TaxID=55513 RepID=UPI001262FDF7|nr:uncharacterized protein LOC116128404 [Pistacia vera]XP_031269978.1 uncharacterized protein LOC116128404 [Pistacia vera]